MKAKSILILEHNVSDFLKIVKELSAHGYSEGDFYNCKSLEDLSDPAVADFSPAFIFVDLNLPGSSSAVDTFLYTQKVFPTLPIVVLTELEDDEIAIKFLELGAQNYLEKRSFTGLQLLKVIAYSTERNQAKMELERLKSDYQNLFNENPLALLVVNNHTSKFHDVNKAAIKKYGYTHKEFTNLTIEDIKRSGNDKNSERREEPASYYSSHYTKCGEVLYAEIITAEINYKNIPSTLITVNDVTDKVVAEEKERKAKQRLNAVFNGTHDAILLADDDGRFLQVNKAASAMLGYNEAELMSLSVPDIVMNSSDNSGSKNLWKDFLALGSQSGIIELKSKNGKVFVCHYNSTAHVLPGLHLSILADVTERENATQKIEEQGKRIENILDSITDCFFSVDKNWIVTYWNKAAERALRLPREQIVGHCLWNAYNDAVDMKIYDAYHKVMQNQQPAHLEDYHPASGKWFDISAYPAADGLTVYFKDITEKKKRTFEIQETKNNYATLINSTIDLIWSIDTNCRLVSFNSAYKKTIEETTGLIVLEGMLLPVSNTVAGSYEQWKGYYERGLNGESFTVVIPIHNPVTGKTKQAEISFNPIYTVDTNTIKGLACYSHDITKQLQYRLLIEEQNERLRSNEGHLKKLTARLEKVMSSSLDIICSIAKDGTFVQVSEASATILGYAPQDLTGHHYTNFIDPRHKEETKKIFEEVVSGKPFTNFLNAYIHKNGQSVPLIWSKNWDNQEEIMFCVARDASSLVEAEKLKAETEQRFTALVQKGADMIGIVTAEGNYKYVSPNTMDVLGYNTQNMIGLNALSLVHPEDVAVAQAELEKVISRGEVQLAAFRFKHASGEWRWIETIATNMSDNPAIKGIVVNSRDITHRKQIETEREQMIKELLKSNSDLKQFSFITSHNLRAPLSNIIGILNIIDYPALDSFNRQMLEMIDTSAKQLGQTIDDLAKILIIKNNVNIEISRISLQETIEGINKVFLNTLNDVCAHITINFKVKEIVFNTVYLESILVNLLSNSIKYRSPNRNLIISLSSEETVDGNVIFRFTDNGSGIDLKMHKNKLFGLYQRFHDKTEGQGLGLFIIKSQIVALGGSIDVESEPDKGTTFTIVFKSQSPPAIPEETMQILQR